MWLAIAAGLVVLLGALVGVRTDLGPKLEQPAHLLQVSASLVTGITAAIAAFHISLPDRSPRWLALPAPSVAHGSPWRPMELVPVGPGREVMPAESIRSQAGHRSEAAEGDVPLDLPIVGSPISREQLTLRSSI